MPTLRRKGRYWYLRDRSGGHDTETATGCTDKKAAEAFQRQWERDRADPEGARRRSAAAQTTVQQALDLALARHTAEHRAWHLADATLRYYDTKIARINATLGPDTPLAHVDAPRLDAYIVQRRDDGATDHTIYKELAALETALALARRGGLWDGRVEDVMPVGFGPKYEPRDRFLSVAEVRAVIAKLPPDRGAWVALACGAGAELAALERAQRGDWSKKSLTVRVRGTKNERRDRHVPVVLDVCRDLLAFAWKHAKGEKPTLLRPWAKHWRDLQRAARKAKIAPFSLHSLRHTFAAWHLAAGVSWDDLARALGHVGTTMLHRVYGHLTPDQLAARLLGVTSPDVPRRGAQTAQRAHGTRSKATREKALPQGVFDGSEGVGRVGFEPTTNGLKVRRTTNAIPLFLPGKDTTRALRKAVTSPDVPRRSTRRG